MRSSLVAVLCLALVALATAEFGPGSHEFHFGYGSSPYSSEESRESGEKSDGSAENQDYRRPSFYTKDVLHGLGPQHSFLTVSFPKPNFPEPYKPETHQPHSSGYHQNEFPPRYDGHHEQYDRVVGKPYDSNEDPSAKVSVVKTRDGKKIMTMTKPGYKMVVEEMEGKPDDKTKMHGRTVKETNSSKVKGDNGETMHQSQSYQYQVVQSESSDDKKPGRTVIRTDADPKDIDFGRFAQPRKDFKNNFPSEFPGQYGFQQHQEFVKNQRQNPFGFQAPEAFNGLRIPPVHNVH